MLTKIIGRIACFYGFHDFSNTYVPHVLICTRCNAFRKVSSY